MPSRCRATCSRMAKARPSDCTPPRWRSSTSSSILGSLEATRRAIAVLRGPAGLSLVFGLVRDFKGSVSTSTMLNSNDVEFYQPVLAHEQPLQQPSPQGGPHHTTIAIDVQYYE